ncbi:MAG: hypothetical protein AUG74_19700 [Bacteroidetes bacterium 13_1_20CM_4_60_6]|nr:MAG: hypothetical protein AUG74_19700 [Bacteroidetes bacterium 13_1_20CM_4_60_6]
MRIWNMTRCLALLATFVVAGCKSLDVVNPNEPSSTILTDPTVLESVAAGTLRTWFNSYSVLEGTGVLSVQARTLSSSWNNGHMNFYSGIDISPSDTTADPSAWTRSARSWQNDLSAAGRTSVEVEWFGMYSTLSSANDALRAIRIGNVQIGSASRTKRAETIAQFTQAATLMVIALNYDQGYYLDETKDLTKPEVLASLTRISRKALRDSALKKLDATIALANANTFTTETGWANGVTYHNTDIAKIANTMAAMLLTFYPRDDGETSTAGVVDWAKVASYASKGMSTGTPDTLAYSGDGCTAWCQDMMPWFTDYSSGRISTRVAHFIDPATQLDPYPLGIGNPQPNSPDKRMGDGSFGDATLEDVYSNVPKTPNAGTDFSWSATGEVFRPDRGYYHQSNIGITRWDASGKEDPNGQYAGYGYSPVITPMMNDLLWAEAKLRQNDAAGAATLIDKTRVTRGGLSSAALAVATPGSPADGPCMSNGKLAKDGTACTLWSELLYEYEIELLQMGPASYWNQRRLPLVKATAWERATACRKTGCTPNPNTIFNGPRYIQGLIPGTPREMPVPAKELAIKAEAFYTFGGKQPAKGTEAP